MKKNYYSFPHSFLACPSNQAMTITGWELCLPLKPQFLKWKPRLFPETFPRSHMIFLHKGQLRGRSQI